MDNLNSQNPNNTEVSSGLLAKVVLRIDIEKMAVSMRQRFMLMMLFFIVALVLFIPVLNSFKADINSSGFIQYASLLATDFKAIISDWQNYTLSLLESFPAVGAAELLVLAFSMLFALQKLVKYSKAFFVKHFIGQIN